MDSVLNELKEGIRKFQTEIYPANAQLYLKAANVPQEPAALIITCADSRIDPESITQSKPGKVFVTRNVGNLVPAYGEMMGGVSAVVEYAVSALKVRHIVVCGHTDCGAMKALLRQGSTDGLPTVKAWLTNAHAALSASASQDAAADNFDVRLSRLTQENVLLQLQHLRTHPSVAGAMARGELTISGWVYNIGTGEVLISENGERAFHPIAFARAAA